MAVGPPKKQRLAKRNLDDEEKIPEKFMEHVISLGFQENDAAVLYRDRENWIGQNQGLLISTDLY